MRGRVTFQERESERALYTAWKAEWFARQEKLREFKFYAKKKPQRPRDRATEALNTFRQMQAAGVPVRIKQLK